MSDNQAPAPSAGGINSGGRPFVPGGGGRNRGGRNRGGGGNSGQVMSNAKSFTGDIDDLKGHIYDCVSPTDSDRYLKTTTKIQEYIGRKFDFGELLSPRLDNPALGIPILAAPDTDFMADPANPTQVETMILTEHVKLHIKQTSSLVENNKKLFSVIKGQCTDVMIARLEASPTWAMIKDNRNGLSLLALVKQTAYNFHHMQYTPLTLHKSLMRFSHFKQKKEQSVADYKDAFMSMVDVHEAQGGKIGGSPGFLEFAAQHGQFTTWEAVEAAGVQADIDSTRAAARQQHLAVAFLVGADPNRFGSLITDLNNQHVQQLDTFPKTLETAYQLLLAWKPYRSNNPSNSRTGGNDSGQNSHNSSSSNNNGNRSSGGTTAGAAFVQQEGTTEPGQPNGATFVQQSATQSGGKDKSHITCFDCGQPNHYKGSKECPNYKPKQTAGSTHVQFAEDPDAQFDFGFCQVTSESGGPISTEDSVDLQHLERGGCIPDTWILLDNQSTCDIFKTKKLLRNIRQVPHPIKVHTSAGTATTDLQGDLPGYDRPVWYHPNGIANVLSLKNVRQSSRVTYDSDQGNSFAVHRPDGTVRNFVMSQSGLFYLDIQLPPTPAVGTSLVQTVKENMQQYSKKDVRMAKLARALQKAINRPSLPDFLAILDNKLILNCPVTRKDAIAAEHIFGPDLGSLKGKTTRQASPQVHVEQYQIPPVILARYKHVTLAIDVMRINGLPFLISVSEHIAFGTGEYLENQYKAVLLNAIRHVLALYERRGLHPTVLLADGQFAPIEPELNDMGLTPNLTSNDEHVGIIERYIRTLKERVRAEVNTSPFLHLPKAMTIELLYRAIFFLNLFPPKSALLDKVSPRLFMIGFLVDYQKHCQLEFGTYVQTHEEHDNSMNTRTIGALAMRPSGNAQGGHRFFCLSTNRIITRKSWTVLPMPDEVIARVHYLAMKSKLPKGINFTDRYDGTDLDAANDEDFDPSADMEMDEPLDPWVDNEFPPEDTHASNDNEAWHLVPARAGVTTRASALQQQNHDQAQANHNRFEPLAEDDEEEDEDLQDPTEYGWFEVEQAPPQDNRSATSEDNRSVASEDNRSGNSNNEDNRSGTRTHQENRSDLYPEPVNALAQRLLGELADADGNLQPVLEGRTRSQRPGTHNSQQSRSLSERLLGEIANADGTSNPTFAGRTRSQQAGVTLVQHDDELEGLLNEVDESLFERLLVQVDKLADKLPVPEPTQHSMHPSVNLTDAHPPDAKTQDPHHNFVTAQFPMKKGLKLFGDKGTEAVRAEMKQLHDRKVVIPRDPSKLTEDQRKMVLEYLMFLKEKRSGKIKGRGCADGRKQRSLYSREESTSPTVALESVLLTATIEAKEGRDVATVDIPGAFMQADQDDTVHVRFRGKMAELLARCDPALYNKYIVYEKGEPVLYGELSKALYGTLRAALLFWKLLTQTLLEWDFEVNPYDWCVANAVINGKQCTVVWHVDDLKISHMDEEIITHLINRLSDRFGQEAPLTVTRGKVHDYLGMILDYSEPGKVKVNMTQYIQDMLDELPPSFDGTAATPAANHLFAVDQEAQPLSQEDADKFHTLTAKLLFLCKRGRPDIQTAVSFLCTRVSCSDTDDMKKLRRVFQYLCGTLHLLLILEADNLHLLKWFIDGSFAVHWDMKGHTGGLFTLGKGAIIGISRRQKLNTRSSTESELVAVDDCMPTVMWTRYFMEAQGYQVDDAIIYQDNMSSMLLERNGMASSSRRTRHINIRYFFVTDRIKAKEIRVEYCPSKELVADFFTKPLQGQLFYQLRSFIMNCPLTISVDNDPPAKSADGSQECVGN